MTDAGPVGVGFAPEEIRTSEPTRSARLKWVVVVDSSLPTGLMLNAAVCVAAATAERVTGLSGSDGKDAAGSTHPGLPWAGCTILTATTDQLARLRSRADASDGVFVADMPAAAQQTRVYDEYLERLTTSATDEIAYYAVSVVGPRNRVAKLVHRMDLLT